jgi:hypothetical protein
MLRPVFMVCGLLNELINFVQLRRGQGAQSLRLPAMPAAQGQRGT